MPNCIPKLMYKFKKDIKNLFYDGFNSKLIETAMFDGILEIPIMKKPKEINIPQIALPFSERKKTNDFSEMLVFYELDGEFRDFVSIPQNFINEVRKFKFITTPDCSLYRDMPLIFQLSNIAVARSVGYYLQQEGMYVIPNVRWSDERTYTQKYFDEPPAFCGIPKESIVSIGTYGCIRNKEDKYHLKSGLNEMLTNLKPKAVIVYGSYNKKIFSEYENHTKFYPISDWITCKRKLVI